MKIEPGQVLAGIDGQPITDAQGPLTLGRVCETALQSSKAADGAAGYKQFVLAERIHQAPDGLDLPSEDIVIVKACIGGLFLPMVQGPAWRALEGNTDDKDD